MALTLKEPHVIEASYMIVTPMFIGDAEQKATGISPASVKGALRFWWRALNWGRIRAERSSDTVALQQLHEEEGNLFGSSTGNGKAAKFTLRLDTSSIKATKNTDWPKKGNDPSGYLGIGLWESGSHEEENFQAHREYIKESQSFNVKLHGNLVETEIKILEDMLLAWGLFGGLGSRSRRAFGSVAITELDGNNYNFLTVENYKQQVDRLLSIYRLNDVGHSPFTAFSNETKLGISKTLLPKARDAHAKLGQRFKNYRGLKDSPVRGKKKLVFGLPYADGDTKEEKEGRRASPLIFHIQPIEKKFIACVLFIPAIFHHDKNVKKVDYSIAKDFLSKLKVIV